MSRKNTPSNVTSKRARKDILLKNALETQDDLQQAATTIRKVPSKYLYPSKKPAKRRSCLQEKANSVEKTIAGNYENSESATTITDQLQQLERHVLGIPSSNPSLPTPESIDIVNAVARETLDSVWERQFQRSALVVTAIAYEEYMRETMLPLIFDDMGVPEPQRAAIRERIYKEREAREDAYCQTYGAELWQPEREKKSQTKKGKTSTSNDIEEGDDGTSQ